MQSSSILISEAANCGQQIKEVSSVSSGDDQYFIEFVTFGASICIFGF
jgi:hypothetical protein